MFRILQYYARFQSSRSRLNSLPSWARAVLFLLAVPGIVLLLLSILAVGVSILALLLLTLPVYRLMVAILPDNRPADEFDGQQPIPDADPFGPFRSMDADQPSPGRRRVDVTIIEPERP